MSMVSTRKGPQIEMDGAMARAERSNNDADLPAGLTRREYDILAFERQWW